MEIKLCVLNLFRQVGANPILFGKQSRKSMNYNRDYACVDECKELFGLEKIGMNRMVSNFRIEKIDKNENSWTNNWKKVYCDALTDPVIYCVMNKDVSLVLKSEKMKADILKSRKLLKEYAKIGVFRGIFRVSDFNGRNVLLKNNDELVSIDEG